MPFFTAAVSLFVFFLRQWYITFSGSGMSVYPCVVENTTKQVLIGMLLTMTCNLLLPRGKFCIITWKYSILSILICCLLLSWAMTHLLLKEFLCICFFWAFYLGYVCTGEVCSSISNVGKRTLVYFLSVLCSLDRREKKTRKKKR